MEAHHGTWEQTERLKDGKPAAGSTASGVTVKFNGREFHFFDNGKEIQSGTYTFDLSKSPRTIDILVKEDTAKVEDRDVKGKTLLYVYEVKGDTLKMAGPHDNMPSARPSDLTGSVGYLYTFKKIK